MKILEFDVRETKAEKAECPQCGEQFTVDLDEGKTIIHLHKCMDCGKVIYDVEVDSIKCTRYGSERTILQTG